jgi:hypothetical protein
LPRQWSWPQIVNSWTPDCFGEDKIMLSTEYFIPSAADFAPGEICGFNWSGLTESDVVAVAWAYYYFSIQFRENLQIACALFPDDKNLARLKQEECNTDNLSPYPGIALAGEKLDHDEFMRRALALSPLPAAANPFQAPGEAYLREIRAMNPQIRALSIVEYENGGLQRLFTAMLDTPCYDNPLVMAFRFFMSEHIRFDSDPIQGHGALSRHIKGDEDITPLWDAFRRLLLACAPAVQLREPAASPAMQGAEAVL